MPLPLVSRPSLDQISVYPVSQGIVHGGVQYRKIFSSDGVTPTLTVLRDRSYQERSFPFRVLEAASGDAQPLKKFGS